MPHDKDVCADVETAKNELMAHLKGCFEKEPEAPEKPTPFGLLERLVMFFRRVTQCSRGCHWNMKYDSGLRMDIGNAGTCLDCGYRTEGIKWPRAPRLKHNDLKSVARRGIRRE